MPRQKRDLNTIYISERLQESLRPISRCALTTVVAPMGYGKTTAVNWYLTQRAKAEPLRVIRVSVYSDNLAVFWRSAQDAFAHGGFPFLRDCACPADTAAGGLLTEDLCRELEGETPCYIFIDDFHLLTDSRLPAFLCRLANRLPDNVHLIVASRDRFLPGEEVLRLGRRVCQIGTEQLRLNHTELAAYARRCGARLSDGQLDALLYSSEGWFSAVYLNLRALSERGVLPGGSSDIYAMFTAAMLDPLSGERREFLAVMGLADEFTAEMARFITESPRTEEFLSALTEQNAFVTRLPDGVSFRFHHMMKECARREFRAMAPEKQAAFRRRFGIWYERHGRYLHAIGAYSENGDCGAVLRVVEQDAGILMAALRPQEVLDFLDRCPVSALKEHPLALLVLMRRMFTWRQIPKMMELKALLEAVVREHPDMSRTEQGDLLGERDLIMSFLYYNDISAMSRLHRSASAQMSRPAISIRSEGGWTFGSPSVLMMFHRQPGALDSELAEMDECMPHYYKVTRGHGQGAETVMRAEALLMQGRVTDAQIALERARAQLRESGQMNMALCCDFLELRLSLYTGNAPEYSLEQRRAELLRQHNADWLHVLDSACAYYRALLGQPEKIPRLFRQHELDTVSFLAPGRPMMEMIETQVWLAQGAYARAAARGESLLALCEGMHYGLVALHARVQLAAAYERLRKPEQAREWLARALEDAGADSFVLPFAENYRYLKPLLAQLPRSGLTERIAALGELAGTHRDRAACPAALGELTEREREIVLLAARRLSNREIAERLFLSEGSVKQYINQIYAKLGIEGDVRTKRQRLAELAKS